PTVGLVSRAGIIPISHSQDTAGPMARTVTDAAILLGAIMGPDARDSATGRPENSPRGLGQLADPRGLRGVRLGIARKLFGRFSTKVATILEAVLNEMKAAGAVLIDPIDLSV